MKRRRYLGWLLAIFCLIACQTEDLNNLVKTKWTPELAVPLINSRIDVETILNHAENEFIDVDSNKFITLVYEGELYSLQGSDLFQVPDVKTLIDQADTLLSFPFETGTDITLVYLASGEVAYEVSSVIEEDVELTITIPALTDADGNIFEENIVLEYKGAVPVSASGTIDLGGYTFDLSASGVNNSFVVEYLAEGISSGIDYTSEIPFLLDFNNLVFDYLEGYFKNLDFDVEHQTLPMRIFKNWKSGEVIIQDPELAISISNSFGIPVSANFSTFESNSETQGLAVPITTTTMLSDTFELNAPTLSDPDNMVTTQIQLNNTNSNIENFISIAPDEINLSLLLYANISDSSQMGFIKNNSRVSVDLDVELPMQGNIDNVLLQDTFQLGLSSIKELQNLETATFKLQTANYFPLSADMQIYFTNEDYTIIDSLITGPSEVLAAGKVNEEGRVVEEGRQVSFFELKNDTAFQDIEKMILQVKLNTSEDMESIKLFSDYYLGVKLGVQSQLNLNRK